MMQRKNAIHQAALVRNSQETRARLDAYRAATAAIRDTARAKKAVTTRFAQATFLYRTDGSVALRFATSKAIDPQEHVWLASWRKSVRESRTHSRKQAPSPYTARATDLCAALRCVHTMLAKDGYDIREWELSARPALIPVPGAVLPPRTPGFFVFAMSKSGRVGAHMSFFLSRDMKVVRVAPGM